MILCVDTEATGLRDKNEQLVAQLILKNQQVIECQNQIMELQKKVNLSQEEHSKSHTSNKSYQKYLKNIDL